ncbi:squalene/phytoene synthase family protein [Patescibacteria group bacterium]|nr:squalene/phytoene synthase family protein [Patescibacteria group bacterium]
MDNFNKQAIAENITVQQISSSPILALAASFWESDRQDAFKICYSSMRIIDDLVDDLKEGSGKVPAVLRRQIEKKIHDWLKCLEDNRPIDEQQEILISTMKEFRIPLWPWTELAKAMIYDLDHNGFSTFSDFLKYSEGAAVSPGGVFMHLCGVNRSHGQYVTPSFNVREAARPLALFSYLVHIVRDFQKDQLAGLNYFADDLLSENNLSVQALTGMAQSGVATDDLRGMIRRYHASTEGFRHQSRQMIDRVSASLEPRYWLSLEIIYHLYFQIFGKINLEDGNFSTEEMNPSPDEVKKKIMEVTFSFQ